MKNQLTNITITAVSLRFTKHFNIVELTGSSCGKQLCTRKSTDKSNKWLQGLFLISSNLSCLNYSSLHDRNIPTSWPH